MTTTTALDIETITEPVLADPQPENAWRIIANPSGEILAEYTDGHQALAEKKPGDLIDRRYRYANGDIAWWTVTPKSEPAHFPGAHDAYLARQYEERHGLNIQVQGGDPVTVVGNNFAPHPADPEWLG